MNIWENIKEAFSSLKANKLRSALTMLGIVIGVAAVILVVAIGQGGRSVIMGELEGFGVRSLFVMPNYRESQGKYRLEAMTKEDARAIALLSPAVSALVPQDDAEIKIRYGSRSEKARVLGTTADYSKVQNLKVASGRFISDDDDLFQRKVGVVGAALAEKLFNGENPLGKRVRVDKIEVTVIGVMERKDKGVIDVLAGEDLSDNNSIYVPFWVMKKFSGSSDIWFMFGQAESKERTGEAAGQIVKVLDRNHGKWNDRISKFMVARMDQALSAVGSFTAIIASVIGSVAAISLVVGGIGIMNIMLVSVRERTREIGVRKAIGARRGDILMQFLIEAVVLCIVGGSIGIGIGAGGATIAAKLAKWPPLVSWGTVSLAFGTSAAIGMFFGIYPASRASRLDPAEALRYE
jgi:putative ABC transport system permease protein